MSEKVGRPIDVGDVLSMSTSLLMRTPILLVPQAIVLVVSLLEDLARASTFSLLELIFLLITAVVSVIVAGAYPSLVKDALQGQPVSIGRSLGLAANRFGTLLIAGILVGVILLVGFVALVLPGIIFLTWYAYTVPAIMLENKGVLGGMSSSKAFGRDKKWSTFVLFVVIIVVAIIVGLIQAGVGVVSPLAGTLVYSILSVPLDAWVAVVITYTYLVYGPFASAAGSGAVPEVVPSSPVGLSSAPGIPASRPPANYCRNCGSPLEPGSRFCGNCGQAV